MALAFTLTLTGCSGSFSFGRPDRPDPPIIVPPNDRVVEPNGQVIEPARPDIEIVNHALSQAQTTRTLVRQLSRP
jgi:hypothetical protein